MSNVPPRCDVATDKLQVGSYAAGRRKSAEGEIVSEFRNYRKKALQQMRPYVEGETLDSCVSISEADRSAGSPKAGDMIARSHANPTNDQWLVAADFFAANYELAE